MSIDTKMILSSYRKGDVKRKFSESEVDELVSKCKYPYPGLREIIDLMDDELEYIIRTNIDGIVIYGCLVKVYIKFISNQFLLSLVDPGTPIGPDASDAIGQQATQVLLNAFHAAGCSKSGGPDGVRENISISKTRKTLYSVIHFNNDYMDINDALDLKRFLTEVTLGGVSESILPFEIDFSVHSRNPNFPRNPKEAQEMFDNGQYWWYKNFNINTISLEPTHVRMCLRMKLNVMKLFSHRITTGDIAKILGTYSFYAKLNKNKNSSTLTFKLIPIPSPTIIGVIDCFIASSPNPLQTDHTRDFMLQNILDSGELQTILISGIREIKNFYPMSLQVTSLIREVEEVEGGTFVYVKNNRFSGIPVRKLIHLCKEAGLEVDDSNESKILNLEYNSHKTFLEKRSKISVSAISYTNEQNIVQRNKFLSVSDYKPGERFFKVFYSPESYPINREIPHVNFNSMEEVDNIIKKINSGDLKTADKLFGMDNFNIHGVFSIPITHGKKIGFIIGSYLYKNVYTVDVNVDEFNNPKSLKTLQNEVNKYFGLHDFDIPKEVRLPKITKLETVRQERKGFLLKTKLCFRDDFVEYNEKENKFEDTKPVDILTTFLNNNVDDVRIKEYVYAEVSGSSLLKLCSNTLIDSRRTYSNHFRETFGILGIEGLRNLLAFDLLQMVNSEGYINPKYPLLVSDVITSHGMNPMSSEGITSQANGVLSTITFDNAKKYISIASLYGQKESTCSTSTSIFLGKKFGLGTGFAKIRFDEKLYDTDHNKSIDLDRLDGLSFIDSENTVVKINNNRDIEPSKFPKVQWVMNRFVKKDILFYVKLGIDVIKKKHTRPKTPTVKIMKLKNLFPKLTKQ